MTTKTDDAFALERAMDAISEGNIKRTLHYLAILKRRWDALNQTVASLRDALAEVAPEEPINQDEMGGCIWCGGRQKRGLYTTSNPKHHSADCPWLKARMLLLALTVSLPKGKVK